VSLDQYLAIAYFQEGVSNFLLGDFEEALANFNDTLLYLRGNTYIDYEQLGLKFRLYSCEVLFNRGLCYIYLQQFGPGMQDLEYASKEKVTPDHDVINDAIRERAEVSTLPVLAIQADPSGIYRVLNPRRSSLSAERSQGQEPQNEGLSRQVTRDRCQPTEHPGRYPPEKRGLRAIRDVSPSTEKSDKPQSAAIRAANAS
jgi:tetratricopeptide (TPR) repeat protein